MNRALCERLRAHLGDRLLDREALVFTEPNGTPLKFGSFYSQRFKPAVRAVLPEHLHGLRFHDLRHTYASLLVEQGAHPKEMAELMGHSSVQITLDRYSHVMPRMTSALADRMDSAYRNAGLVEPPGDRKRLGGGPHRRPLRRPVGAGLPSEPSISGQQHPPAPPGDPKRPFLAPHSHHTHDARTTSAPPKSGRWRSRLGRLGRDRRS